MSAKQPASKNESAMPKDSEYLLRMRKAGSMESSSLLTMLPVMVFAAIVIMIVRVHNFKRPMSQFPWTSQTDGAWMNDFFSYNKMVIACLCALAALIIIGCMAGNEKLAIKRTKVYIPMAVYTGFVLLSYLFSDLKVFAGLGWNDRFEGTLPILGYMIMLFFTINAVKGEKNVKQLLWALAGSSFLLNLLGLGQWADKDFFKTVIGQKLITRNYELNGGIKLYDAIDAAAADGGQYFNFEFYRTTYQTVYNPNYVSFYLTLLIPLFTMILLYTLVNGKKFKWIKSLGLVGLVGLQVFNAIASRSAGGYVGLAFSVVVALVVLNKKLFRWWKPILAFVIAAVIAVGAVTSLKSGEEEISWLDEIKNTWLNEVKYSIANVKDNKTQTERVVTMTMEELRAQTGPAGVYPYFDYMFTSPNGIEMSIFGNPLSVVITRDDGGSVQGLYLVDGNDEFVQLLPIEGSEGVFYVNDNRFYEYITLGLSYDTTGNNFVTLRCPGISGGMVFVVMPDNVYYFNPYGNLCQVVTPEAFGFKENLRFGSQRGYIWSRTFPMLKDTIFVGHGADTYCAYFPQTDYSGKYNAGYPIETIVDKPHNLYLGCAVNTGCISLVALLALFAMYFFQSVGLYIKGDFGDDYLKFAGSGILFGVSGFLAAAMFNDSTVSVMPMFYSLLGTGIAINLIIKNRQSKQLIEEK